MKQRGVFLALLAIGGLLASNNAPAQDVLPPPAMVPPSEPIPVPPLPVPPLPPSLETGPSGPGCPGQTISVPRVTLMEKQHATTIPRMKVREEVIGHARGLDVEYREKKQIVTEWILKPREVVQQVPCTTMVPVTTKDPCTGKCHTHYESRPIVRPVKITVFDPVAVPRVVTVSVPCLKPGKPLLVKKLVVDTTMEPAICTRLQILAMPNQVHVPHCPTCPLPHP